MSAPSENGEADFCVYEDLRADIKVLFHVIFAVDFPHYITASVGYGISQLTSVFQKIADIGGTDGGKRGIGGKDDGFQFGIKSLHDESEV